VNPALGVGVGIIADRDRAVEGDGAVGVFEDILCGAVSLLARQCRHR